MVVNIIGVIGAFGYLKIGFKHYSKLRFQVPIQKSKFILIYLNYRLL